MIKIYGWKSRWRYSEKHSIGEAGEPKTWQRGAWGVAPQPLLFCGHLFESVNKHQGVWPLTQLRLEAWGIGDLRPTQLVLWTPEPLVQRSVRVRSWRNFLRILCRTGYTQHYFEAQLVKDREGCGHCPHFFPNERSCRKAVFTWQVPATGAVLLRTTVEQGTSIPPGDWTTVGMWARNRPATSELMVKTVWEEVTKIFQVGMSDFINLTFWVPMGWLRIRTLILPSIYKNTPPVPNFIFDKYSSLYNVDISEKLIINKR